MTNFKAVNNKTGESFRVLNTNLNDAIAQIHDSKKDPDNWYIIKPDSDLYLLEAVNNKTGESFLLDTTNLNDAIAQIHDFQEDPDNWYIVGLDYNFDHTDCSL